MKYFLLLGALLVMAGCSTKPPGSIELSQDIWLERSSFDDLKGFHNDALDDFAKSLALSCAKKPYNGTKHLNVRRNISKARWKNLCDAILENPENVSHTFIRKHFTPYLIHQNESNQGLFTGYFEPILQGSSRQKGDFQTPIYGKPRDLKVACDLKSKGVRIITDKAGQCYASRAHIEQGALKGKAPILGFTNDPIGLFFMHIQGSGMLEHEDGARVRLSYAATNGHPYVAVGKVLVERGVMAPKDVSMQSIVAWLERNPNQAQNIMNQNPSYVFFKKNKVSNEGPVGSQGVPLMPYRSIAIDRSLWPYGLPFWLETTLPDKQKFHQMMVAQDTGGAIKGAIRADIFLGSGKKAGHVAGLMKQKGRAFILLPH